MSAMKQENPNRNRQYTQIDPADVIKARVSVPEAVDRYTGQRIERNRICCPVHHGTDKNMRIYRDSYYCYVCHATGDVIQFVRAVTGDTFQDAMKRINADFALNLPLDGKSHHGLDKDATAALKREVEERKLSELFKSADSYIDGMRKANIAGLLHEVEIVCKHEAPKSEQDEWSAVWCEAMRLRELLHEQIR